ncbi:MAG: ABC transporter permease subunit [Firmicutes bacterium]|nr:ABC transporter permease subunit [Bacillota bacterium]
MRDWTHGGLARGLLAATALIFLVAGLGLVAALFLGAWRFLGEPSALSNLFGDFWDPLRNRYGVLPFIVGSVVVTLGALVMAVPLALGVAVTLAEQRTAGMKDFAVRALTVLTAVPSVIFGWWGLQMVVPWVRARVGGPGFSLLAAGIVLALMVLPTFSLFFFQSLERVPQSLREGSAALGATPDQTLWRVAFRAAMPGLTNGLLVGVARALGETMAVQMVIGGQTALPSSLTSPGATLTTQIITDMTVFPPGTRGHAVLDIMALLLMLGMYVLVRLAERWGSVS